MLSVIICTHNPPPSLYRVIEALRAQTLPLDQWELLMVDNASTIPISERFDISWHPNAYHMSEPKIGLAYARILGIRKSYGSLIIFVDDDNVLAHDYLDRTTQIEIEYSHLGAWGSGTINPEFEVEPAEHLKVFIPFLALRSNSKIYWSNQISQSDSTPVGAGLCVRRFIAEKYAAQYERDPLKLTGHSGSSLTCGEDNEICYMACEMGLGMGTFPGLKMTHIVPRQRVTEDYFLQLLEGNAFSHAILNFKWRGERPFTWGILSYLRALVTRRGFDRKLYFAKWRGMAEAKKIAKLSAQKMDKRAID
jgi:glycosyltransferase involved in cell wall biosynthesis